MLREIWVVGLETSCGLAGVDERDEPDAGPTLSKPGCGRGGSGGGVPSLDGTESALADALRDRPWMMFKVGFAKLAVLDCGEAWLCCVGVVGGLCVGDTAPEGSAFPGSSIKAVGVDCHRDSDAVFVVAWREELISRPVDSDRVVAARLARDQPRRHRGRGRNTIDLRTSSRSSN